MDAKKKRKLRKMGGRVTTVAEFLDLSEAEQVVIEMRLELAAAVRKRRAAARVTQAALAKAIGSSQGRVAKMEGGDPQASIESLVRALAALGGKPRLKVALFCLSRNVTSPNHGYPWRSRQMSKRTRRHHTAEQKAEALRRHRVKKEDVSAICEDGRTTASRAARCIGAEGCLS